MNFGAFLGNFGGGFAQGVKTGKTLNEMIKEGKLQDLREQGMAEAEAQRAKSVQDMVKEGGVTGETPTSGPVSTETPKVETPTDAAAVSALVSGLGDLDVLVNCAGVLEQNAFSRMTPAQHQQIIDLNISGLTAMLAHFLPPMLTRGAGRILNVASIAAFTCTAARATTLKSGLVAAPFM